MVAAGEGQALHRSDGERRAGRLDVHVQRAHRVGGKAPGCVHVLRRALCREREAHGASAFERVRVPGQGVRGRVPIADRLAHDAARDVRVARERYAERHVLERGCHGGRHGRVRAVRDEDQALLGLAPPLRLEQ